jgi:putative membrane protein
MEVGCRAVGMPYVGWCDNAGMNVVAQVGVVLAGLVHVLIFAMESVLFTRAQVYGRFRTRAEDVGTVRQWAFNQGWYNLFLAAGAIGGVIAVHAGNVGAGRSVALFSCACMLGAALVLACSDRRMLRGALMQGVLPLAALLAAVIF